MVGTIAATMPTAAWVTDQLLRRYGPDELRCIERLSEHLFRARKRDDGIVLVTVLEDGALSIREPEVE